ncbi:MAG: FAD-dependent oxidoreductase [Dysgonamonadaceae bacterium]|jgi:hypothetical protein|nr:FAD-dependent oxidoreductase [Dysgonamonadaceae bacterium]
MSNELKNVHEPARDIRVRRSVDVLVVGGGPAGLMAAEAASRGGVKVMLVEARSFLGGNLVIGIPILAFLDINGKQIIKGLPQRFIDRMRERNAASEHFPCKLHMSYTLVHPEESKTVAMQIMEESGVEVLMNVFAAGVVMEGRRIGGVVIESKSGREAILAKTVIDCTGDGDIACLSGVEWTKGDEGGGMQPPTLMFCMRGVEVDKLRDAASNHPDRYDMDIMPPEHFRKEKFVTVGLRQLIRKAQAEGLDIPVARTILITGLRDDEVWVNMSRVSGIDATRPESLTFGENRARKQMYVIEEYLRRYVPGFEKAWIEKVAPFLGIRESRVIKGKYVLSGEDLVACRRFDDRIAVAGYPLDIHHAEGDDCTMIYCKGHYDIPYRALLPESVEHLLVAGRCASMTHEAMAATRVMSTCMAMGEAAGRAARIALLDGVAPSQVEVRKVQQELIAEGAYLRQDENR